MLQHIRPFRVAAELGVGEGAKRDDLLAGYIALYRETRARHRDRLDVIAYEPPGWVVDVIGERPSEPERRAAWNRIVDRAIQVRTDHEVPDDARNLLGPEPPSSDIARRATWMAARRSVEKDLRQLARVRDQGFNSIAR